MEGLKELLENIISQTENSELNTSQEVINELITKLDMSHVEK
ncbi:hypothetical protein [Halobacillus salinus]|nr:hypothetical protein [Halobacillus salinus]